jgi:hypothetical protein
MQRERMARSRMSTTRLRTQTRVQLVVEVGESRARATTPSPNLRIIFFQHLSGQKNLNYILQVPPFYALWRNIDG